MAARLFARVAHTLAGCELGGVTGPRFDGWRGPRIACPRPACHTQGSALRKICRRGRRSAGGRRHRFSDGGAAAPATFKIELRVDCATAAVRVKVEPRPGRDIILLRRPMTENCHA